ncbi:MAG TPA: radical SAM protein [Methylomirabilota bacterium]|nr:radical SAM protein [Methylomirabilota bacterium]
METQPTGRQTERPTGEGSLTRASSASAAGVGPREFFHNRFVYAVISQRARGLSIGVNLNPDRECNFDCVYCEVDRARPIRDRIVDPAVVAAELKEMLGLVENGGFGRLRGYEAVPPELLVLKEVALSGDGEPTLCPNFVEVVEAVIHVRAQAGFPFFKIVLITNGTGLDRPEVQAGLKLLTLRDEVWAKVDAGTQAFMDQINRSSVPLRQVLDNILALARARPVVIQSLFALVDGHPPPPNEIEEYALRLRELKEAGAQIPLVQVYSAHRPAVRKSCDHLPLRSLSQIARRVRDVSGLRAEVF